MKRLAATAWLVLFAGLAHAEPVALPVANARAAFSDTSAAPVILITLTREGGKRMASFSEANIGKRVDLLLDGDVIASPVITAPISRWIEVNAHLDVEETTRMATHILERDTLGIDLPSAP